MRIWASLTRFLKADPAGHAATDTLPGEAAPVASAPHLWKYALLDLTSGGWAAAAALVVLQDFLVFLCEASDFFYSAVVPERNAGGMLPCVAQLAPGK